MNANASLLHLSDAALIAEVSRLASCERRATVALLVALIELDRRRLYLSRGYSSLFEYCRRVLALSEHEALNRIEAARALRRHPALQARLESGALTLTALRLLAPHLTTSNCEQVAAHAAGKTTEEIRRLVASLNPQPPVPSVLRKLPEPRPAAIASPVPAVDADAAMSLSEMLALPVQVPASAPASRRPVVAPLSESHYKLQVTISAGARERLAQIQGLMRHRLPSGDPAAIVEHALEVLHAELLKQKAAQVAKPRAGRTASEAKGRYIPASVKREVWRRDEGRCAFVAADGTRCGSQDGLEFHHVQPYAVGGEATSSNIEMRCRAHNGFEWTRHLDDETLSLAGTQA